MATAGDGKNIFSQEAGQKNSIGAPEESTHQGGKLDGMSVTFGKSELEQMVKQMTFTRSEGQSLISLVQSRIMEGSPSPVLRLEPSTASGSLKRHKLGDERDNFHASSISGSSSRVLEEKITSPAELANTYKGNTIGHAPKEDPKLINNNATGLPKTPVASQQVTIENLPNELLLNIFIRLLAKQLAQMRSVSKSWNALLSKSSFIKSHLNCSIHNNDQILLVCYDFYSPESKPIIAHSRQSPHLKLTNFIKLPVNLEADYTTTIRVIGCVNGLICSTYTYSDSVIHIWNPSLSAVLTLPPYFMPTGGDHESSFNIYYRFGFDPKTDDYKVVKLTGLFGPDKHVIDWWLPVEIYSMRKGSWSFITGNFPSLAKLILDGDYVCVDGHDGHLHWLCCSGESLAINTIVAFDLGSETFSEMPLPNYIKGLFLGAFARKLCVMSWDKDGGAYEVWVMDKYGVADSWVKRLVLPQFTLESYPFGFTSHNEFLIEENGRLVLYDPVAKKAKILENYRPGEHALTKIVEYVDSLVWVAPAKHEMVADGGKKMKRRYYKYDEMLLG